MNEWKLEIGEGWKQKFIKSSMLVGEKEKEKVAEDKIIFAAISEWEEWDWSVQ